MGLFYFLTHFRGHSRNSSKISFASREIWSQGKLFLKLSDLLWKRLLVFFPPIFKAEKNPFIRIYFRQSSHLHQLCTTKASNELSSPQFGTLHQCWQFFRFFLLLKLEHRSGGISWNGWDMYVQAISCHFLCFLVFGFKLAALLPGEWSLYEPKLVDDGQRVSKHGLLNRWTNIFILPWPASGNAFNPNNATKTHSIFVKR